MQNTCLFVYFCGCRCVHVPRACMHEQVRVCVWCPLPVRTSCHTHIHPCLCKWKATITKETSLLPGSNMERGREGREKRKGRKEGGKEGWREKSESQTEVWDGAGEKNVQEFYLKPPWSKYVCDYSLPTLITIIIISKNKLYILKRRLIYKWRHPPSAPFTETSPLKQRAQSACAEWLLKNMSKIKGLIHNS